MDGLPGAGRSYVCQLALKDKVAWPSSLGPLHGLHPSSALYYLEIVYYVDHTSDPVHCHDALLLAFRLYIRYIYAYIQ